MEEDPLVSTSGDAVNDEYVSRIELTDGQWAAFSRELKDDPKRSALQACCANISALRDVILRIRANNGYLDPETLADLRTTWDWCRRPGSHGFDEVKHPTWLTLKSLIEQAGLPWRDADPSTVGLAGGRE